MEIKKKQAHDQLLDARKDALLRAEKQSLGQIHLFLS
jgi:hypothetical protein